MMPIILTFVERYLPGYKAGGALRTIANLVEVLGDEFKFKIITRDRDSGDENSYPNIQENTWNIVGKADVLYLSPRQTSLAHLSNIINSTPHDIMYFNSFFSSEFTIKPLFLLRLMLISDSPTIIAPRGEFSPGALGIKVVKKNSYIKFFDVFLNKNLTWQASTSYEKQDICQVFKEANVLVAQDPSNSLCGDIITSRSSRKIEGNLNIIFLSRISPKKNLAWALKQINGIQGNISFDIFGVIDDDRYWKECLNAIRQLQSNIQVHYHGPVPHNLVSNIFSQYDLFFLPTLGENFGHAILESLVSGCPVLISDLTPWRNLEDKKAGWDISLDRPDQFQRILQQCTAMNEDEHSLWRTNSRIYGELCSKNEDAIKSNINLFESVLNK